MAVRDVLVRILGDSLSLERAFVKSTATGKVFGKEMEVVGRQADRSLKGLSALTSGKGFAGGIVFAGIAGGLAKVVSTSSEAQQILGQTKVALADAGVSWDRYGDQVEAAAASLTKLGFEDEDTLKVIAKFVRSTGDVGAALRDTSLAADVARARYIDLDAASQIVLKASLGMAGQLRRLGIDARNGSTGFELLTLLTQKYGGAAQKAAGDSATSFDRFHVALKNVEEQIGSGLLPVVTNFANALSDSADSATALVKALQQVKIPGLGSVGGVDIPGALGKAARLTPGLQIPLLEKDLAKKLGLGDTHEIDSQANTFFDKIGGSIEGAAAKLAKRLKDLKVEPPAAAGASASQRNTFFDNAINRALFRAGGLDPAQQVAALKKVGASIEERIAATKDITRKLNLEDQLIAVNRQSKTLTDQIGQDFADRIAKQKLAQQEAAAARVASVTARQFRELGLGADGNAVTPGVDNLRKRLGNFSDAVKGTFLDTSKTQSQLARFRKVLSESLVPKDVRAKFGEMLDDLNRQLREHVENGPLTKTTALSTNKILSGLGLSPDDERQIRARLSKFNTGGQRLAENPGARGALGTIVVQAPDVFLDGQKLSTSVRRSNTVHARQNPKQKRGRRF